MKKGKDLNLKSKRKGNVKGKKLPKSIIGTFFISNEKEDDSSNYYHPNEFDLKDDELDKHYNINDNLEEYITGVENKIQTKIENSRNELLKRFDINVMKNKVNINEIIDVIFKGQDEIIFREKRNFVRVLIEDTDKVINNNFDFSLDEKLSSENKNISSLKKWLNEIKCALVDFIEIKIQRHKNLNEFANLKINEIADKFNEYFPLLYSLKNMRISEVKIDCNKNELIAEICFLLLVKIYKKEIKFFQSVKKKYEKEIIKNLVYEEIAYKLDEIRQHFEKRFSCSNFEHKILTELIEEYLSKQGNKNNLSIDKVQYILLKMLDGNEIDLTKNEKFNFFGNLFYLQNS